MTYQSDDYYRLSRNFNRVTSIKSLVDLARKLSLLKYVDRIVIVGNAKDGEIIQVDIAAAAKNEMLNAAIASLVASAEELKKEPLEPVDLMKSIAV